MRDDPKRFRADRTGSGMYATSGDSMRDAVSIALIDSVHSPVSACVGNIALFRLYRPVAVMEEEVDSVEEGRRLSSPFSPSNVAV